MWSMKKKPNTAQLSPINIEDFFCLLGIFVMLLYMYECELWAALVCGEAEYPGRHLSWTHRSRTGVSSRFWASLPVRNCIFTGGENVQMGINYNSNKYYDPPPKSMCLTIHHQRKMLLLAAHYTLYTLRKSLEDILWRCPCEKKVKIYTQSHGPAFYYSVFTHIVRTCCQTLLFLNLTKEQVCLLEFREKPWVFIIE